MRGVNVDITKFTAKTIRFRKKAKAPRRTHPLKMNPTLKHGATCQGKRNMTNTRDKGLAAKHSSLRTEQDSFSFSLNEDDIGPDTDPWLKKGKESHAKTN